MCADSLKNQFCSSLAALKSAFIFTPKSAVKSIRRTRRVFSTITNSLMQRVLANLYNFLYLYKYIDT